MFLACKSEETPRCLNDLLVVAYKLMYKWDPSAPKRIRQRVKAELAVTYLFDLSSYLVVVSYPCILFSAGSL